MKFLFVFSFILLTVASFCQSKEAKPLTFGVLAGFDSQILDWSGQRLLEPDDRPFAYIEKGAKGGSIGFFGNRKLSGTIALRAEPTLSILENEILYSTDENPRIVRNYRFTDIELPLHLVFTNKKGNFPLHGSFLIGGRVGWNLAGGQHPEGGLSLYRERWAGDLGLGVEINLKHIKFQPELIYSAGLNNINDATLTPQNLKIGKVVREKLSLRVLVFLGQTD